MKKGIKIQNLKLGSIKKMCMVGTSFTLLATTLTGCGETELATNRVDSDSIVHFNQLENFFTGGIQEIVQVPGEDWSLVIEYSAQLEDSEYWTITDNKELHMKIYTQGLPEGYKVYINDIHSDTTIVAKQNRMNGITQDTMDDGVHGTNLLGYPISDTTCCYIINEIEGQNDDFISGSVMGFQSYTSGTVQQQRFQESDYLEKGVIANQVSSIFGLLVKGPNDTDFRGIDVDDEINISVYPKVSFLDDNGNVYEVEYQTDENGNVVEITYTPEGTVKEKKKIKEEYIRFS